MTGAQVHARTRDLEQLVRGVADGIEAGHFFPQPGPNAVHCTVCDYRSVCDARIAHQAAFKARGGQTLAHEALPDFGEDLETLELERLEGGGERRDA